MPDAPPFSHVAFHRNVTHGRNGITRDGLIAAYRDAGAVAADTFLASGNVAFGADDAEAVAGRVRALLRERVGFDEPAFVRSLAHLAALVEADPFAGRDAADVFERFVTFFPTPPTGLPALPITTPRGDMVVFRVEGAEAFGETRLVDGRPGAATAPFERMTGGPVTSRNWNTVCRLVARYV